MTFLKRSWREILIVASLALTLLTAGLVIRVAEAQTFAPLRLLAILDGAGNQQIVQDGVVSVPVAASAPVANGTLVTGTVTCGATATQLPANATNNFTVKLPGDAAQRVFFGGAGVTATSGDFPDVPPDGAFKFTLSNTNLVFCIVASGSEDVSITGEAS